MNKNSFYCIAAVMIMTISSLVQAQDAPSTIAELKSAITTIQQETNAPSIAVALVDKNGPVLIETVGMANIEQQTPATADTLYRMGSVSKMFAGIAVMQLVDQQKLSLDDKVAELLPDFEFSNPWAETHPLKVMHLLEHTTGWDVHLGEYAGEAPDSLSLKDGLALHPDSRESRWPPGTRQTYSNTGPVVAARIVEEITGMRFEDYAQQFIFAPMNMPDASFVKTDAYLEKGAACYTPKGVADYLHIYSRPSSSLNTSVTEMANVVSMLVNAGQFNGKQILSADAINRMQFAKTTIGSEVGVDTGYGVTMDSFGYENSNTAFYGHTGGLPGAVSEIMYQPELQMGYVFMINQANRQAFDRVSNTLKAYVLKDVAPKQVEKRPLPEVFKTLDGYYTPINPLLELGKIQFDITGVIQITTDDTYLHHSPLMEGWSSNNYAPENGDASVLYSEWSGLPSVAIVDDPIVGNALQIEGNLYQKTSALVVYTRLVMLAISMLLILSSLLYGAGWAIKALFTKKPQGQDNKIHWIPAVSSLLLFAIPAFLVMSGADPKLIMTSTAIVVFIYVVSALYPIWVVTSVYFMIKTNKQQHSALAYGYAISVIMAHVFITGYLISYGLLPFNVLA